MRNCLCLQRKWFRLRQSVFMPDFQLKQEKLLLAIKVMKEIEEVLVNVVKSMPKWSHLLKAVDSRVDKSLSILRPQALADHRSLLASLRWPPPLSTSSLDKAESLEVPNPLLLMHGDKKERYTQSFLTLCALQHFQAQRELRQQDLFRCKNGHSDSAEPYNNLGLDCSLWTIDELVSPIASRTEHHFSRWSDQPKFMFALVYKITRDFIGVDDVLQPLIDKARLVGYSAREAWVSAMVKILSGYLSKRIFSVLAERYHNRNRNSETVSSWLHLVDLIISFDKQMQVLASSGTRLFVGESTGFGGFSRGLSVLSIFCDRPEWLDIWAAIELKDAEEKLKTELADDKAWTVIIKKEAEFVHDTETESFLLSTREDYKAPLIVESVVRIAWTMIERCRMLPSILMRVCFIRSSVSRFLWWFFRLLLHSCQELESSTAYVDDDALLRIASSINAARYCESVLREWSEGIDFLEMRIAEGRALRGIEDDPDWQTFFVGEINTLMKLETEWVEEILAYILRQFNILCWDYIQNGNQWEQEEEQEESGFDAAVSVELVEALDALRDRLRVLKMGLNSKDFLDLWRSVAGGLDHFMFSSVLLSGAEFSGRGIRRFRADVRALFLVFQPFCARPEAFFPCISNSMKLLEMGWGDVKQLMGVLSKGERRIECLQMHGVFHVSPAQVEKILRNRKFGG
ncbi:RINT1-like protein MAG2L isoform X2 [Magnolia sinica]|uniref:RINT1-like protein MAG2L isoform X2 n=1 Tax=Magnolia sinica TaxID=86752 RepID=UPI00265B3D96|nr:RINT1-like protein MAG2L isoform X2 [Magnolia sinica]